MMPWPNYRSALPPELFIGRLNAIKQICGRLTEPDFSSTSVVGGPRTGKTSLLRYLASACANAHLPEHPVNLRVYLDVEIMSSTGTSHDFWISLLRQFLQQNPILQPAISACIEQAKKGELNLYALEDLFDECARRHLQMVILVDNWDFLLRNLNIWPPQSNLLHLIRYFGQRMPRTVAWIVSSKRPLQELWDTSRGASPYYNIFVSVEIPRLEPSDLSAFYAKAVQNSGSVLDPEIEQLIHDASFGHPFLASYVIARWFEKRSEGKSVDSIDIEQAFKAPDGPLVSLITEIRSALSPSERQILDQARTSAQLTANQKAKLQILSKYGMIPPGMEV